MVVGTPDLYNARDEGSERVNALLHVSDLLLQAFVLAQLATLPAALVGSPGPFDLRGVCFRCSKVRSVLGVFCRDSIARSTSPASTSLVVPS